MNLNTNFSDLVDELTTEIKIKKPSKFGTLVRVVGLTLEARGLEAPLGAICEIVGDECSNKVDAEVVGFQDQVLFLFAHTLLQSYYLLDMSKKKCNRVAMLAITSTLSRGEGVANESFSLGI